MRSRIHKSMLLIGVLAVSLVMTLSCSSRQSAAGQISEFTGYNNDYPTAPSWQLAKIDAENAQAVTRGGAGVIIAILDTGIDDSDKELQGKVIKSVNFSPSPVTNDIQGHGTGVAGVIAAKQDVDGITGLAFGSLLLNVKVADDAGWIRADAVANGILWATNHGANVINMSFALDEDYDNVELALEYAWNKGVVIVAAAGNYASTKPTYPAASPYVIGVAATDENDALPKWSNIGDWVSVSAPGVNIYTTMPNGKYAYKSGTCFASAVVSGEAALLFSLVRDSNNGSLKNDEVKKAIRENVVMRSDGTDAGRIDADKAMTFLLALENHVQK